MMADGGFIFHGANPLNILNQLSSSTNKTNNSSNDKDAINRDTTSTKDASGLPPDDSKNKKDKKTSYKCR
ncbi:hypothetical protein PT273_01160 [Orbaceae bacterium ESL0727]|nr:hypothetical protein [Orbaceae bacterium ESL0727]